MLLWKVTRHQDAPGSASAAGGGHLSPRRPPGGISQARRTSAQLIGLLRAPVKVRLNAYGRGAASGRPEGEHLAVDDNAQLMTALDQGSPCSGWAASPPWTASRCAPQMRVPGSASPT